MHLMLTSLFINEQPALTVTDKAYGRTAHFHLHHTEVECRMMAPNKRIVAEEFDKQHRKARLAVEDSFSQHVTKFPHSDNLRSHKVTQGDSSNWIFMLPMGLANVVFYFFHVFCWQSGNGCTWSTYSECA
jgi:hypothetical protein